MAGHGRFFFSVFSFADSLADTGLDWPTRPLSGSLVNICIHVFILTFSHIEYINTTTTYYY